MKRYVENKESDLRHVNLPFLSAVKKKQLSPEKKGGHVTQLQFRFIALQSRPKIIQIFSKTSRSKASPFLFFAIFWNSGLYLPINIVVFDHSIFPNNMSPEAI